MTDEQKTKNITAMQEATVQERYTSGSNSGISILNYVYRAGELLPPWWSRQRDAELEKFFMRSDHLKGAVHKVQTKLTDVQFRVLPRNPSIKSHIAQANFFQKVLVEGSEMGKGWTTFFNKWLYDLFIRDNGAFAEIVGKGDPSGAIEGPALGLLSLDSMRCQRTSDPEYPVIYTDTDGKRFKLHHTRVIFASQMPSTIAHMHNVGRCWITRCIDVAQNLVDISVYKQEKLGSRPLRQMMIGKGLTAEDIWEAVFMANESMDNMGFSRYAGNVVIGSQSTDVDIDIKDLASVPDGFDERTSIDLGMFTIALAGGFPPRDLWPATTTGATRADAMFQHLVGGAGYRSVLNDITILLAGSPSGNSHMVGKFLPPHLKLVFDFLDDDQDEKQSNIKKTRAETRTIDLNNGTIDTRTARQQALESGDINQSQFNALELKSGRLPMGIPVVALFNSDELLDFGFDIVNVESNLTEKDFIIEMLKLKKNEINQMVLEGVRESQQGRMMQLLAAVDFLLAEYEGLQVASEPTEVIEDEQQQLKQVDGEGIPDEVNEYEEAITELVEQANNGEIDAEEFEETLTEETIALLTLLFLLGAGVDSEEGLTVEQREALDEEIAVDLQYIPSFSQAVFEGQFLPEDEGGQGNNPIARAILWATFAASVYELGKMWNLSDPHYQWVITPGKDSCTDCIRLNGQVHTAEEWRTSGYRPKSRGLACKGYNCGCSLISASGPSRGGF